MPSFKNTLNFMLLSLFLLIGCSRNDEVPRTSKLLQQGTWKVSLFVDNGTDETHHFSGYVFTFSDSGVINAVKAGAPTVTGSFNTGSDDSQNKMIINFGSAPQFNELNEDWRIIERSNSRIRLEHVSGGNGGTDLLTLERINQ
jgi:major membrane immunogen (membrane-anchored lipoprotein)